MKTKHTPGPWKVRQPLADRMRGEPIRTLEVLAEQNGIYKPYVADVRSLDAQGDDNTAANARLIAAAPDLLAALKVAEGIADWALDNGAHPGVRASHRMIRAAIAKAEA